MDIKVTGSGGIKSTDKTKAKKRADGTSGPSFASMLEQASEAEQTSSSSPVGNALDAPVYTPLDEDVPREPKAHGEYLLGQLEELEKDILLGSPSQAVANLKKALDLSPLEEAQLSDKQRQVLDELHLRAAVEIAKTEDN